MAMPWSMVHVHDFAGAKASLPQVDKERQTASVAKRVVTCCVASYGARTCCLHFALGGYGMSTVISVRGLGENPGGCLLMGRQKKNDNSRFFSNVLPAVHMNSMERSNVVITT